MVDSVVDAVVSCGFARISLTGEPEEDLPALEALLQSFATPIRVFLRHPFWKPMTSDPKRPPGRSGGVGFNSLHLDCVNVERPPDVIVLYCVQRDPLGGGDNIVSVTDGIEDDLSPGTRNLLESTPVSEGAAYDLDHVGEGLASFSVLDPADPWPWRYSGRILESSIRHHKADFVEALLELDRTLLHRAEVVSLQQGDALFINQRRTLHGRLPLGRGQERVPLAERRELAQAFARLPGA